MKKISFLFILFLLTSFSAYAQDAGPIPSGTIMDKVPPPYTNPLFQFDGVETAFAFQTFPTPTVWKSFPIPGYTETTIGPGTFTDFASSGIFAPNGTFYMTTAGDVSGTSQLYTINTTTGAATLVANVSGATTTGINGITYDPTTGIFYVCTGTNIYTINVATGVTTAVGPTGIAGGLMIDIAVDCNGTMYGVDLGTDNTYTINKSTGTATLLGPLGFNLNFGAGMTYDKDDDILYLFGLEGGVNINALRTINTTTGAATTLHTWVPALSQFAPFDLFGNVCAPPQSCNFVAGSWHTSGTYPNMPATNYFSAAAWLGDTLYVQSGGSTGAGTTTIYRYTPGGSWTTGVSCPVGKTGASMSAAGGKLYLIGGGTTTISTGTNSVHSYDPSTGAWTTAANLPAALSGHSSVTWGDSVIFVVGGPYTGSATNLNVHYYRVASDSWGTITNSLPSGQGRRTFGLGIAGGNKIVMSSGFNTAFLKSTYVGTIGSDASSVTWAAGPDAPTSWSGLSRPGATAYGDWFFLNGGEKGGSPTTDRYGDTTYVYDVNLNQWIYSFGGMPYRRSNHFNQVTARCIDDTVRIFVSGGYGSVSGGTPGVATDITDVTGGGQVIVGVDPINNNTPDRFSLSQNYPNPFNPVTKIRYEIPKQSFVIMKVFDITGREVAELVGGIRGAGVYEVDFDGSALSSGTYFYRIQAGDFVQVKKMVLLK